MKKKIVPISFSLFLIVSFLVIPFLCCSLFVSGQIQSESSVEAAFPNLNFNAPVGVFSPNDDTNRLFVIEQAGTIRVFVNSKSTTFSQVFLDVGYRVLFGGEQGLLGMAFHPAYSENGYFYIKYVTDNPRARF
jgi:hypothetical protein